MTTGREPASSSGRTGGFHTPFLHRRPRGLLNRRSLSKWAAGRNLHPDGKRGLDDRGIDGVFRYRGLGCAAARSSAPGAGGQALAHPVRALGLDRQRAAGLRQVDHGLYLPLARAALLVRNAAAAVRHSSGTQRECRRGAKPDASLRRLGASRGCVRSRGCTALLDLRRSDETQR